MVIISFWYPHWCTFMIKDLTSPEIIRIGFIQRQTVLDYRLQSGLSIISMKILSGNTNNTHKLINNSFHCQCFFPFVYLSLLDQLCLFNYNCDYHMIKGSCRFSFNRWQVLYLIDFSPFLFSASEWTYWTSQEASWIQTRLSWEKVSDASFIINDFGV